MIGPNGRFVKKKTTISQKLRKQIWEMYIGPGKKSAMCPLCEQVEIEGPSKNSGFQAAHIIADKFLADEDLSVFYLFPGCASCNNECADECILDYLLNRLRIDRLSQVIWQIFTVFARLNSFQLSKLEGMAWKVLDFLYGPSKFTAGGGIQNTYEIYKLASAIQLNHLNIELRKATDRVTELAQIIKEVTACEIKPLKLH